MGPDGLSRPSSASEARFRISSTTVKSEIRSDRILLVTHFLSLHIMRLSFYEYFPNPDLVIAYVCAQLR